MALISFQRCFAAPRRDGTVLTPAPITFGAGFPNYFAHLFVLPTRGSIRHTSSKKCLASYVTIRRKVGLTIRRELTPLTGAATSQAYEKFANMIESRWESIAGYCELENNVALGFVKGLSNKIRVI